MVAEMPEQPDALRCGEPVIGPEIDHRGGDGVATRPGEAAVAHHSLNMSFPFENEGPECGIVHLLANCSAEHTIAHPGRHRGAQHLRASLQVRYAPLTCCGLALSRSAVLMHWPIFPRR